MIDTSRLQRLLHQMQTLSTVPQANRVAASIAHWFGYYRYLQIVLERYHEVYTAYAIALQRYQEPGQQSPSGLGQSPSAAPELASLQALYTDLHTAMDHFCVFAKAVLDGMAETFQLYFAFAWEKIDVSHARLLRDFARLCQEKNYVLDPAHLQNDMHAVHDHLQQHTPAVTRHPAPSATPFNTQETEKFMRLVTLIDRYIDAMLQFLEVNVAQSILHRSNSPPEIPQT